jgi:hypothetical protein
VKLLFVFSFSLFFLSLFSLYSTLKLFLPQAELLPVPANISESQLSDSLLAALSSSLDLAPADFTVNTGEPVRWCEWGSTNCQAHLPRVSQFTVL